ncbi:MAG: CHAD domain-containing protein [Deltaproteobacteria bacterium]
MTDTSSKSAGALARHLSAIIEHRLQKLVRSVKDSYVERSVDTVHDLRVASRRLRAFAVTFSDGLGQKTRSRLEKKLRRVTKTVATLRDLDVLVALVEERSARATSDLERASLEHLLETLDERRSVAAAQAEARLQRLDVDALSELVRSAARDVLGGLLAPEGQRAHARILLERLILDAAAQEPPKDGAEHAEQLHCLRIAIKELRYALEFLEPVLGGHFGTLYARAESLQELLGTHHDLTVLREIVVERSDDLARRNRPALSAGLQHVGAALMAERQAVLERFRSRGFECDWWRNELRAALEPG